MNFLPDTHKDSKQLGRQLPLVPGPAMPVKPVTPVKTAAPKKDGYILSIRINLPDYEQWRLTKFARHYPFLSIVVAVLGLLAVAFFIEGAVWLWHSFHQPSTAQAGLIFRAAP